MKVHVVFDYTYALVGEGEEEGWAEDDKEEDISDTLVQILD